VSTTIEIGPQFPLQIKQLKEAIPGTGSEFESDEGQELHVQERVQRERGVLKRRSAQEVEESQHRSVP